MAAETARPAPKSSKSSKSSNYWQQTVQNRMLLVVLLMVVGVPLLALPSNPQMQNVANYALRVMAALLAGILVMRARVATKKSEFQTFAAMGANLPVLLLVADAVLSLLIIPREYRFISSVDLMRVVTGVLLYFALAYHVRRSEHLTKIQDALVVVAAIISFFGLANLAMSSQASQASQIKTSLYGDHQLYGAMMMMLFPITLVAAITEKQRWRQIAAQSVAAITFVCLIITETRTAWAGAIAEVIALLIFAQIVPKRNNQESTSRKQYLIPALIVLTCVGLFLGLGGAQNAFNSRLNGQSSQKAMEYRNRMWFAAWKMIERSPLIGNGLGSFSRDQNDYSQSGRNTVDMSQEKGKLPSLGENAHSFWLQTGAEQGLLGIGIYVAILATFLVAGVKRLRFLDGGIRRWLLLASIAAVIGFTVDGLGNPAWQFAQIAMFFWLMLGLGVACLRPRNPRGEN